jgi:micrococcal nuclease
MQRMTTRQPSPYRIASWPRRLAVGVLTIAAFLWPAGHASAQQVPPEGARYAASKRGQVYYWIGCDAWRRLSPENLTFFESAAEAEAAGYVPSRAAGCEPRPEDLAARTAAGDDSTALDGGVNADLAAARAETPMAPPDGPTARCTVERIIDGDTIQCREHGRVRLLLIDTPELSQRPWGQYARAALAAMLPVGSTALLEFDVQPRDRYGRILSYVYGSDSRMVNEVLVRAGYALVAVVPPNVKHVDRLRRAAAAARAAGRGLWSTPAFECAPADHRRGRCED